MRYIEMILIYLQFTIDFSPKIRNFSEKFCVNHRGSFPSDVNQYNDNFENSGQNEIEQLSFSSFARAFNFDGFLDDRLMELQPKPELKSIFISDDDNLDQISGRAFMSNKNDNNHNYRTCSGNSVDQLKIHNNGRTLSIFEIDSNSYLHQFAMTSTTETTGTLW